MPRNVSYISMEPNFSDEELEEVQELLWRGYAPEPYRRYDFDTYIGGYWRRHRSPEELKAVETERAERYAASERELAQFRAGVRTVLQYTEFRCDNCHQTFRSVSDETEIDKAYRETFGENATEERLAVCEGCYDLLMKELRS